jgi:hypothetical protein
MMDSFKNNSFSNFQIVTNNVHAILSQDKYITLPIEFSGTMIYFEYNPNNNWQ